jgi:hypothetical protein
LALAWKHFATLAHRRCRLHPIGCTSPPIAPAELDAARRAAAGLPWSEAAKEALEAILAELAREGVRTGDRRQFRTVAAGAGLASAVCALLAPPVVTAVVSGVTAAGSAVAVQLALAWSGARRFRADGDAIPAGSGTSWRPDLAVGRVRPLVTDL